jgi:tetratricopeptide (TPR) repeat protein
MEKAATAITQAIDLGYADGYVSLGAIRMNQEDYDAAEVAFNSAIQQGSEPMRGHAGLGELYFVLGTRALKDDDPAHVQYFEKAEEAFLTAGKERYAESYERAMDLFETIGWKDKAMRFGEQASLHYQTNRLKYGDSLRKVDMRVRKLAGDDRYERLLAGVSRTLGSLMGGKKAPKDVE